MPKPTPQPVLAARAATLQRIFATISVACALGGGQALVASSDMSPTPEPGKLGSPKVWNMIGGAALLGNACLLALFARSVRRVRENYEGKRPMSNSELIDSPFFTIDFFLRLPEHLFNAKAGPFPKAREAARSPATDGIIAPDGKLIQPGTFVRSSSSNPNILP